MDLISLIVALIIISLFGMGIMLALIIMSQEKDEKERIYEEQAEIQFIQDYQRMKEQKRRARKEFFNKLKNKLKKIFTRR